MNTTFPVDILNTLVSSAITSNNWLGCTDIKQALSCDLRLLAIRQKKVLIRFHSPAVNSEALMTVNLAVQIKGFKMTVNLIPQAEKFQVTFNLILQIEISQMKVNLIPQMERFQVTFNIILQIEISPMTVNLILQIEGFEMTIKSKNVCMLQEDKWKILKRIFL